MDIESQWGRRVTLRALNPARFIVQHIAPLLYSLAQRWSQASGDRAFGSDQEFWQDSTALPLSTVLLQHFRLSDWFPRAPGVYWSPHAETTRGEVWDRGAHYDPELGRIVRPDSKRDLVEEGGIGTIRLHPRRIDNTDYWFTTAVTGSQCAGGVPVAIPNELVRLDRQQWGDTVTVRGKVRVLSDLGLEDAARSVHHAAPLLVVAEAVERSTRSQQRTDPLFLTPVVLFSDSVHRPAQIRDRDWRGDFGYTFVHVEAGPEDELRLAEEWLARYADKFGGEIITNFDQLRPLLADAPLSYQRLVKRTYDRAIIENLHFVGEKLTDRIDRVENIMSVSVTLGDGSIVYGDLVVANSVRDSFNRAKEVSGSNDLRALLERLASQVGSMLAELASEDAKKAADDLDTLTKEATREKPRREWWELSLKGLTQAAEAVKAIGQPVIETVQLLIPVLARMSM